MISLRTVGMIFVVAMLVTPGSIAHLWTVRFDRMPAIAVATAVGSTTTSIPFAPNYGIAARR